MDLSVESVAAIRAKLWDAGFRPVPVLNHDHGDPKVAGKAPLGRNWGNLARLDPPDCITRPPVPHALNTGVLCDGLRAIDIDVDDPEIAARCRSLVVQAFGEAPIRMRRNSSRCLILYRAATGTPPKVAVSGKLGKVEVLGKGQQFVAFGRHPSGAELEWFPDAPGEEALEALPAIAEDGLFELLGEIAPLIEAEPPGRSNGKDHTSNEPQADPLRIAAALHAIPNQGPPDWEAWNRVGMAIWRATGGSDIGWQAWDAWSSRNASYDLTETRARWDHYFTSPPTEIGAGTLFHMARGTREPEGDVPPHVPFDDESAPIFPIEFFRDVQITRDAHDFVEGLLVSTSMVVVYGESNSGKTFFATDLGCHVSCGWKWNEREVERGGVIYCALEGSHGIRHRVAAFRHHHGLEGYDIPFAIVPVAMNLLDPTADTGKLIRTIKQTAADLPVPVRLVVIDTLSRGMAGGNENAPDDMGALVTNGTRIQQETGACVLWVHHSGKDQARGARGHSLLRAATDTEIEIVAQGANRSATVTKQRDMECVGSFPFTLNVVELGENSRQKQITSCVVDYAGTNDTQAPVRTRNLGTNEARALEVLVDLIARSGASGFSGTPSGTASVPEEWWRDNFYERALPGAKQDTKKHAFGRASSTLISRRLVGMAANRVWLVQMHDRATCHDEGSPQ